MAKKGRQNKISEEVANPTVSSKEANAFKDLAGTSKVENKKRT